MMAAVVRGREGAAVELGLVAVAVDIIHPDGPRVPRERRGVPAPPRGAPAAEPELAADHGGVLPPEAVVTHGAPLALTADLDTAAAGLGRGREADRRGARGHVAVVPWRGGHARGARLARAARGGDAAVGVAPAEAVVDAARARARLRPRRACPAGHLGAGGVGVTARLALAHAARLRGGLRRAHGARGLLALVQAHERACGALAACDVVGAVGGHGARRAHLARGRPLVEHEVVVGGAVAVPDGAAARGGVAVGGARGARALVREEALRAPAVRQLRGGVQDRVVRLEERGALRAEARGVAADGRVFGVPAVVLRVVGALEQRRLRPRARHVVHPDGPGAAVERRPRARAPDAPAHQPELPAHHLRVNLRPAVVAHVPPLPELEHHDGAVLRLEDGLQPRLDGAPHGVEHCREYRVLLRLHLRGRRALRPLIRHWLACSGGGLVAGGGQERREQLPLRRDRLVDPREHISDISHGIVCVDLDRLGHPPGPAARQRHHELLQQHLPPSCGQIREALLVKRGA
mmetsp:Transcript_43985/g.103656  ORF Transcript_43985/g.103656 Transcript_43985/m.103656 type:complete len:522 (+) Transcript_43985:3131-4696(+)